MSLDDVDAVLQLEQQSSAYPWADRNPFAKLVSSGGGLTLQSDSVLIGYAVFERQGEALHLIKMAIHPGHRRRGYGSWLLREVESVAEFDPAITRVLLHVRESNTLAVRLYRNHGYEVIEELEDYYRMTGETPSDRKALTMRHILKRSE
jgi:ribosomal-protein-alanine N-acetyltransferase